MSNEKHTPGPWHEEFFTELDITEVDARRIIACVNACEGLTNGQLEGFGLPIFRRIKNLCDAIENFEKQRDELLATLESFISENPPIDSISWKPMTFKQWVRSSSRAAIAKVKGGA